MIEMEGKVLGDVGRRNDFPCGLGSVRWLSETNAGCQCDDPGCKREDRQAR